jgi:hypothetical protein
VNYDIRIKTSFRDHRKRKKLQLRLGAEGVLAFIDLMLMVAETRPEGVLHGMDAEDIALDANWQDDPHEFVQILVSIGLLDEDENGVLSIHGWAEHNAYAAHAEERSAKAKKAAQARWGKAKKCSEHATSMPQAHCSNAPSPSPSPSPSPEEEESTLTGTCPQTSSAGPPRCPHQEIIALYHEVLPELRKVRVWDANREKLLRARWKSEQKRQSLDWWRGFFEYVRGCPFLMGLVDGCEGKAPFQADLEWLVRPTNFNKVIEGKYEA